MYRGRTECLLNKRCDLTLPMLRTTKLIPLHTVLAILVLWFVNLGYRDLIDPDEGRYADIPREMVQTGDWITPRLNGFKYFEKPPLQYWMTATGFQLFGQSNTTARLWPALIGFLGALWVYFLGRAFYGPSAGFIAFVIVSSSLLYFSISHILTLDMSLSVFMLFAVGSFALAQSNRDEKNIVVRWMLLGWVSLALAVLTKGLVGLVLPLVTIGLYMLWQRDWQILRNLHLIAGGAVFLLVVTPWFVLVSQENEEFIEFFFIREHFDRYTTNVHRREGSPYYFLPILGLGLVPWTLSVIRAFTDRSLYTSSNGSGQFNVNRFFIVYVFFIFFFFSISSSKLHGYILPVFPVIALLTGRWLSTSENASADGGLMLVLSVLLLLVGANIEGFVAFPIYENLSGGLFGAAFGLAVGGFALLFIRRYNFQLSLGCAAFCAVLAFQSLLWSFQEASPMRSSRDVATALQAHGVTQDTPVYIIATYSHSLPFYLKRHVKLALYKGELEMGIDSEPDKWISTFPAFMSLWQAENRAAVVLNHNDTVAITALLENSDTTTIYRGPSKVALLKTLVDN